MNWGITIAVIVFGGIVLKPVISLVLEAMQWEEYRMKMTGNRPTEPTVFYDKYGNVWCPQIKSEGRNKH